MFTFLDKYRRKNKTKALEIMCDVITLHIDELHKQKDKIPENTFEVTKFMLEEQRDAYQAMILLLKENHFKSALRLARSILESSINLQYIYTSEIERRAKNYRLFPIKTWLKRSDNIPDSNEKTEFLSYFTEKMKGYLPTGNRGNYWDGKSVKEIFSELKSEFLYDNWYGRLSGYTHIHYRGKNNIDVDSPYPNFLRDLVMRDIVIMGLQTLKVINDKYDLVDQVVWFPDYPEQGAVFFFSVNPKRSENEMKNKKFK